MACSDEVSRLQAKLLKKEALLAAYEAAELAFAENAEIKKYTFDTGLARQTVERISPQALGDRIYQLERDIESIRAELCGTGLVAQNLRRL